MKKLVSIFAAIAAAIVASAQPGQPIPVDPAVRIGHLDNGLTYYIRHNAEPAGQANFYIAQKVGSILEDEEQRGLAHFLEHMCFNGTQHFPGNGVIKYCESIGVKFGANLNAYTSIDETVYNIDNVPVANVPSAIDSCLWILHDWADGLLLTDADIDHERGVIHEEWRTRTNAQMRLLEKILPVAYPDGNRYGNRLPIGLMSVVDNFPYKVLRDYYEKWYRPDQQGVVVVGDIDVDAVEAKIKDIFGTIAKPENPAERFYVEVPDNKEPIICLAKDKEQAYALSMIFCKHDPFPMAMRGDINYYVYEYALYAAQTMMSARLQEILQQPEPPFINAQVGDDDYFLAKTKGAWAGTVVSSETGLEKAVTATYREMLRAVRNGFTASEYERAKAEILSELESAYNSRDKKKSGEYCREYVRHFIDREPIAGAEAELALGNQISAVVTVEMVNQIVKSLVKEDNLVLVSMLPDKEGVEYPTEAAMAAALAAVAAEDIAPYEDKVSDEPLISKLPKAGKVKKTADGPLGYKIYTLSNGATVYFRQTDFNADEIIMRVHSNGGTSLYPESCLPDLKVLTEVVELGGLGNFSSVELTKALAGKKVSVGPNFGMFGESLSCKSTPKDLETMFQLSYLYFTSLRKDVEAFESWRGRSKASIANRDRNPMSALQDTLTSTIYDGGKRVSALKLEDVDAVDYDAVLKIARERFANAADFKFIVTGAVDEATLLPLLEQYVASLPAKGKKEKPNLAAFNLKSGRIENKFEREMEVPMVTNFFLDKADMKYDLKRKLSFDLGLSALSVVLLEEIREKEGGTYGIGAYGELSGAPATREQAVMQITYQTNPEKYEYLNGRVREIVAKFAEEGPSEENLAKGKEYILKNHGEALRENSYWSTALNNLLQTGVDITKDFEATLSSITTADAKDIVAELLKQGNHAEVIMVGVAR